MTNVTGKFAAPGGGVPKRCAVRVELVDLAGVPVIGFTDDVEIVSAFSPAVDADGDWTVDLTPTADIASPRGDTLWRVEETGGGQTGRFHISVPASGTHRAPDLRVELPGEPGVDLAGYLPLTGGELSGELVLDDGSPAASREWVLENTGEGGGGAVNSVNGETGTVVLDAGDVGADPAGTAASVVSAHSSDTTDVHGIANTAALETTSGATAKVNSHAGASDPHGDRAYADGQLVTHASDTTAVHGIADTSALETASGATAKVAAHTAASDPHGDRANAATLYVPKAYTASSQPAGPIAEWNVNYTTDPVNSPDLFRIFNNGVKKTWWNENGSIRGEAAKVDEAAARWYGMSGQTADIWQVLNDRTNAVVLACVKPNGNLVITGSFQGANVAWTVLTSNNVNYTAVDGSHAEWQPAVRLVGPANETVQMRGRVNVTNTVVNDVPFILPSQFRPSKTVRFSVANGQSTAIHGFVDTAGNVTIGRAVTSASWLSFDGVTFSRI